MNYIAVRGSGNPNDEDGDPASDKESVGEDMASTKEYLDFVLEQLSELDEVSFRAMMGEYILYYRGRIFGGIYDDRLLVKPVSIALKLMPDAEMELPYDGAKEMVLVADVDNREFLCELIRCMWEELPAEKRRKRTQLRNAAEIFSPT